MIKIDYNDTINGFFLCYKNAKATIHVIDRFFKSYPEGKIYLYSDNGCDYSGLRKKYKNIIYQHNTYQINPFAMTEDRAKKWANILYETLLITDQKYTIHLEDDVWINRRVIVNNNSDLLSKGLRARFHSRIFDHLKKYEPLKKMKMQYSGFGGTIFNNSIILKQNIKDIHNMIDHYCKLRPIWSDQLLSLMIYSGGGELGCDKYHGTNMNCDIVHSTECKKYYGQNLNNTESDMVKCTELNNLWYNVFRSN